MVPEVSAVMAVYNGQRYLREAIESILNQSFSDFEFIVVDDGSTDGTWDIMNAYNDVRIRLLRNKENIGLTKSLNRGLGLVQGTYVARQDGDDMSLPERLEHQLNYMREHGDVGLLGTAYHVIGSQGQRLGVYRQPQMDTEIRWQMLFHNAFCHSSTMFRRSLLGSRAPFYNEHLRFSQDYECWVHLLRYTRAGNLEEPLVAFRVHDASIEATEREEQQRIASCISLMQIRELIPQCPLGLPEIDALRRLYYKPPQRMNGEDLALGELMFQILHAFGRQGGVSQDMVQNIRRRLIDRMLGSATMTPRLGFWKSGLLRSMLREDTPSVLAHLAKRTARHIKRVLSL